MIYIEPSMRRLKKAATLFTGVFMIQADAAPFQFNNGDLILGIRATSGTGSTKNVFLNLGSGVSYRDNNNLGQLANIDTTLTEVYGPNWFDRDNLYFGIIGNLSPSATSGFGSAQPVNGDPSRTFYISVPTSAAGASALIPESTYVSAALGSAGTKFSGMEQMVVGLEQRPDKTAILDQGLQPVEWNNSWTAWNPVPGAAFDVFGGGIQQAFGGGGSSAIVDLQRVLATNTGANPTGTAGGGTYETSISISSTGIVTAFTPPPNQPEIDIDLSTGTSLTAGSSTVSFGSVENGQTGSEVRFSIQSAGTGTLTLSSLSLLGANPGDFIVSGPPSLEILSATSAEFTVRFTPKAVGARSAILRIVSDDADESTFDIGLSGTGVVLAPEISVEQPALTVMADGVGSRNIGTNVAVGASGAPLSFIIRNVGTAALSGISITKAGANPQDFIVSGPTTSTLTTSGNTSFTTFTVRFQPKAGGARSADLQIASNDGDENPFKIRVTGSSYTPAPEINVEQPFGTDITPSTRFRNLGMNIAVGQAGTPVEFTILNSGSASLTGISVSKTGTNPQDFVVSGPIASTLPRTGSTKFTVMFKPTGAGDRSAELRIASNDGDENPFTIRVVGSAFIPVPEIHVKAPDGADLISGVGFFDAGTVLTRQSGEPLEFVIKNLGTASLSGLKVSVAGKNPMNFTATEPALTDLAPGAETSFTVVFNPLASRSMSAIISLVSNDTNENPFVIGITGEGLRPTPEIEVQQPTGSSLIDGRSKRTFGTVKVDETMSRIFTIRNVGTGELRGLNVKAKGEHAGDFQITQPDADTLAPGAPIKFRVSFKPSGNGNRTADIEIKSNDANENPFDIKVSGFGASR